MSLNTIVKIENGVNTNPTIETLTKIAKALEVGVDDLIKYNLIEFVKFMGHDAGHKFDDSRTLMQPEGVLAMIVYE